MWTAPAIRASSSGICQTISSLVACFGHSFELTPPQVYDVAATCEKEAHQASVEMHGKLRSAQEAPIAIANIIWEALSDGERERKMAGWVARTRPLCSIRLELLALGEVGCLRSTDKTGSIGTT